MATCFTSGISCLPLALFSTLLGSDLVSWVGFEVVWEGCSVKDQEGSFSLGVTDGCV